MRKNKKFMVTILVFAMVFQFFYCGKEVSAKTNNISAIYASLSYKNGKAVCGAGIVGRAGVTKITGKMKLQKITSSSTTTVKTWDISVKSKNMSISKNYSVKKGKYKVVLTAKVYKGSSYENVSVSKTAVI